MTRLLFILTLFSTLLFSCDTIKLDETRIKNIGQAIIKLDTSQNIPDIVFIGDRLFKEIIRLKANATTYNFKIKKGDFDEPYGDDKADCILTIDTDHQDIGIRLKYDKDKDKYHILGWLTLATPEIEKGKNGI